MKRMTISVPDDVDWALRREANRRDVSVSEPARQILEDRLSYSAPGGSLPFANLGASGKETVSEDIVEILKDQWCPEWP